MVPERSETRALWRYGLIAEALNERLSPGERGALVRGIAASEHVGPDGQIVRVSRTSLDRWISAYRANGLDGLRDRARADAGASRGRADLLAEAIALRQEQPARSAAHISEIVFARHGVRIPERTLREQLAKRGLRRADLLADTRTFGRYEAEAPNVRWIADVLDGPFVPHPRVAGSFRARLHLIVDDHSRFVVAGRWLATETLRAGQEVLHGALLRYGLPEQLYTDNGPLYAGAELARCCAILGIRLIHSRPYAPQGRGKQERLNRVIRERFLLEATAVGIASLDELNDRFSAWVERYLNVRVHSETGESPAVRYGRVAPRGADPALLAAAFCWSARRRVDRTGVVSLAGNRYQTDPALRGRTVELRFRPEDMARIEVFVEGHGCGFLEPLVIKAHVHKQVSPPAPAPLGPTGIDYLAGVLADHEAIVGGPIAYRQLSLLPEDDGDE